MATDFNPGADFKNADPTKLLSALILEGEGTKDFYSYETGVKYQTVIPYVSAYGVDISTGAISGYNTGSGQTTITDVTLSNKMLHIREHYKKETIDKKVVGLLEPGTNPEDMPLQTLVVDLKGKALHLANEKKIWQETADFTGVISSVSSGALYGPAAISFQSVTDASILDHVKKLVNKLETQKPEFVTAETIMSMSPANFAAYSRAVYNLNGTVTADTIGADGKPIMQLFVPGTMIKAVGQIGLTGKNDIVLTIPENIIVNYDLLGEDEELEMLYNPFAKWYELTAQWKLGVTVVDASNAIVSK